MHGYFIIVGLAFIAACVAWCILAATFSLLAKTIWHTKFSWEMVLGSTAVLAIVTTFVFMVYFGYWASGFN